MREVKIEIESAQDNDRFDDVFAQMIDFVEAYHCEDETAIEVRTENSFGQMVKIVSCAQPDALSFLLSAYETDLCDFEMEDFFE